MITHPSVAGAAVLAGLLVAGGSYAARHDMGLGSGLPASATARIHLEQELTAGYVRHHRTRHLLAWQPPHVPKIHVHHAPPAPVTFAAPAPVTYTAAPVAAAPVTSAAAPVTRTSPVGGDDGGGDD